MIRELQTLPSRNRVWLNNIGFADIDPAIHIHDVSYGAPSITTQTVERARYHGARVASQRMGKSTVVIQFDVREYDVVRRQDIMHRIVAWGMAGGVLTTDDRPNQQLHVVCTSAPSVQSSLKWSARQIIEFSAFDQPFWEDVTPKVRSLTGTEELGQLAGAGSAADPYVEVRVEAAEDITALTLNVGATKFVLTDISIEAEEALVIYYDETHTLHIKNEDTGVSYLDKRSVASDDDLMLTVGKFGNVSFVSDGLATVVFKVRGLYL